MAAKRSELRIIEKFIRPYGFVIVKARHHNKIVTAEGRFLVSFSSSPSRPHWYKNVIADLRRYHACK